MQNEVTARYWKYIVSENVGVDMFKRAKEKKNACNFFKKKNCLLVNSFLFILFI